MEENIVDFLSNCFVPGSAYGSGYGYGDGSGSDYGSGYGDGSGSGYGSGYGNGDGYGDGDGYGYCYGNCYGNGNGDGSGDGFGSGSVYGYGYGSGYGDGIARLDNNPVVSIDEIKTIVSAIKENVISGYILNSDFTKEKCYVVKGNGFFAHGKSIKEAQKALVEKFMESMDEDEVFEKFMSEFSSGKKYKGTIFFNWHHYLTRSCLMGREIFVKNRGLDLEKEYTVEEFFDLCRNDYGGESIRRLEIRWKNEYK